MSQAIKVGILAVAALLVAAFMVLRIEDLELFGEERQRLVVEFDSVAGLDDRSPVRLAGVRVGRVDGIELVNGKPRVTLLLDQDLPLTAGSHAKVTNLGMLGDKYVALILGPDTGAPLSSEAILPGTAPPSFDETLAKLNTIGDSITRLTGTLEEAGVGDSIARLVGNLEAVSAEIRSLVAANRSQVDATLGNFAALSASLAEDLPRLTRQAEGVMARLDDIVAANQDNLTGTLENFRTLSASAQTSIENLNEITTRLNAGEGTLGKLLNDETAHDSLVATLDSVRSGVDDLGETLGAVKKLQVNLGIESYWLEAPSESQSGFQLNLDPQGKFVYRVGLVDGPYGDTKTRTVRETAILPDGTEEVTLTEIFTQKSDPTVSALFGFKLAHDARFYAGLIEGSGGVAVEYPFLQDRFRMSFEAFDFNRDGDLEPRLRLTGRWQLYKSLYVVGGYDDILEGERDSFFIGGGIKWRDDYLKYLLGSVPTGGP